jgi:AraC-like DNA-binding protein
MRSPGPPRGILRREHPRGRTTHERIAPSAALADYVAHHWTVSWDLEAPFVAETLPHPCVHLIFEAGRSRIAGLSVRRFRRSLRGRGRVFAVKFRPAAFQPLLGAPMSSITERTLSLRSLFGRAGDVLRQAVLSEESLPGCIALVERFLGPRLPPLPARVAAVRDLVERLAVDRALLRVEQAAAILRTDVRTLQRRFLHDVGLGPKWVIQRYRLHEAAERLARPDPPDLAALALELGYFDQSHFQRDFKQIIGVTPRAYALTARR